MMAQLRNIQDVKLFASKDMIFGKEKDVIFIDAKGMAIGKQPGMWFLHANLTVGQIIDQYKHLSC